MSMDWVPWVIRAVLIVVGITAFIMGVILLIVSFMTDLSFDYDLFLTAAGAIGIIIGLVVRKIWEKNR